MVASPPSKEYKVLFLQAETQALPLETISLLFSKHKLNSLAPWPVVRTWVTDTPFEPLGGCIKQTALGLDKTLSSKSELMLPFKVWPVPESLVVLKRPGRYFLIKKTKEWPLAERLAWLKAPASTCAKRSAALG